MPSPFTFPRVANGQTVASHKEQSEGKQTDPACKGASLEPGQWQTAQYTLFEGITVPDFETQKTQEDLLQKKIRYTYYKDKND